MNGKDNEPRCFRKLSEAFFECDGFVRSSSILSLSALDGLPAHVRLCRFVFLVTNN